MTLKGVLSIVFFLIVVVLLAVYWFFPFETIEFGLSGDKNTNFTLGNQNTGMQFYENLRYKNQRISYNIDSSCDIKKEDSMLLAFEIIESLTSLDFYSVSSNEEISVTCDSKAKFEGKFFVAGEGGPTNITQGLFFNVIHNGGILIIRDSQCKNPNIEIHELLHALGFDHSQNPNNVMYEVSRCSQEIGQDALDLIDLLYSFPSEPDLVFENASASMSGRYLDVSMIIRNYGLKNAEESEVIAYADNKSVETIGVEQINIGGGRIISLSNILVLQKDVSEIRLAISYGFSELNKDNNAVILKIKS